MKKLEGTSMNIVQDNIEKLKEIFPEIFTEGKIDFEVLKQLLGEKIETDKERYSFTWKGKTEARQVAQDTSTGTLRPSKEDSKDWDNTENLYIEGDNLEVLKLLQKSYHGKIKMIYIDPPYNTGKDFVYKDNFKDNLKNYLEVTGQLGEEGQKLSTNSDSNGRYHSDWLNMMYPRLKLARNLLTDDGVIFISIDDNEIENIRKLCNEVFGEENFVNQVIWVRNSSGKTVSKQLTQNIEYLLMYSKTTAYELNPIFKPLAESTIKMYSKDDNDGRGKYRLYPLQKPSSPGPETTYDYIDNTGKVWKCPPKGWRMKESKLKALENDGRLCMENGTLSEKAYWNERTSTGRLADTYWDDMPENSVGTKEVSLLFEGKVLFNNPKPIEYLTRMIEAQTKNDEECIILDFFSGSGSIAHAVMQYNSKSGNRKYIMVQLPEACDEKSEAYKAGYKNICEIGKERIRRAGEKIKEELEKENSQLKLGEEPKKVPDIGFKVFKLDSSNIKEWDSETDNLKQMLLDSVDNIKIGRTTLDVLYEILLKYGLDLNVPIEENENFYSIGGGTLLVNFDKEINMNIIDSMCEEYRNLLEIDEDFKTTVILRDSAFKNDVDKTNAIKKLEQVGIKEVKSI